MPWWVYGASQSWRAPNRRESRVIKSHGPNPNDIARELRIDPSRLLFANRRPRKTGQSSAETGFELAFQQACAQAGYEERTPAGNPFPTLHEWWDSTAQNELLASLAVTYTSGQPTTEVTNVYTPYRRTRTTTITYNKNMMATKTHVFS